MTPTAALPTYEVYAIRYATVVRRARDNFLAARPRDAHDAEMPLDFYVWLVRGAGQCILVDTGFSAASGAQRNRQFLCPPDEALRCLGVSPQDVQHVVLTHLHYDHAGNTSLFPAARIHLQDAEMNFATGRYMCHPSLSHFFAVDDVKTLVGEVFAGRVEFHDGDGEVAPGVTVHRVGGHTHGLQVVRVHTVRGWLVLASDASHYYDNRAESNPFPAIVDLGDLLEGWRLIDRLADSPDHVIPGHDPAVRARYRRLPVQRVDIAVLHEPPTTAAPPCAVAS